MFLCFIARKNNILLNKSTTKLISTTAYEQEDH